VTPSVSVIIASYNTGHWLVEAVDSVRAQVFDGPVEIVVVEDGSSDGTDEVARGLEGIRLIEQPNAGVAAAQNAGIRASTGELLAFLDADDLMAPGKLQCQVGHLMANPSVAANIGREELLVEPGASLPVWARQPDGTPNPEVATIVQPLSIVVRREVFDAVGPFDEDRRVGHDVDWMLRFRECGYDWVVLDEVVLRRRIHAGNQTQDAVEVRRRLLRALRDRAARRRESLH
jgi:glycosyltransferase involved in cell wall biosynthesis